MALVCDIKSDNPEEVAEPDTKSGNIAINEDLEDGEIEDDEEETPVAETSVVETPPPSIETPSANVQESITHPNRPTSPSNNKFPHTGARGIRFERPDRHRYDERKRHLTEAEKSVLHLHKIERLEREKRDKYKRDQPTAVDDFASNIEKAIASILKKDKGKSDDDENEESDKRGKKRKKKDKEKKNKAKQRKQEILQSDNYEVNEPLNFKLVDNFKTASPVYSDSYDSNSSTDRKHEHSGKKSQHGRTRERSRHNEKKNKNSKREPKTDVKPTDTGVCLFYLQGKCNLGDDCMFSHDVQLPMKLELCKFYVMECCAKGDNCSYMHSSFPCKFYHTGLQCRAGDSCKFAHGKPLSDGLKQILFKHIETAPKEILGDFPRLNRDGTLAMLNQAQKALDVKYGGEKAEVPTYAPQLLDTNNDEKVREKKERNRQSRWQDPEPLEQQNPMEMNFGFTGFYTEAADQDMRISSNGDIDMRTLPSQLNTLLQNVSANLNLSDNQPMNDVDIRCLPQSDTDIRFEPPPHLVQSDTEQGTEESNLEIVTEEEASTDEFAKTENDFPSSLPKKQRELFLRIQSHQKDTVLENQKTITSDEEKNIDWYSDDDDDGRLMIKDDIDDSVKKTEDQDTNSSQSPHEIKPGEVLEKLGDLSKIDISVEVTKLLSSLSQSGVFAQPPKEIKPVVPEPVTHKPHQAKQVHTTADPRKSRSDSTDTKKTEKLSIYEQGSISLKDIDFRNLEKDVDLQIGKDLNLRSTRPDVDLRNLGLPFKPMQNYTPATEIDGRLQSHQPITWRVRLIDIPQPNYTGLKLSAHDAKNTGDPRLRKIFRLSTEEKESPASPKEIIAATISSPKSTVVRVDPRLRKVEDKSPADNLNYSQQLNMLQTSAFYQSLSSNQKVLLNQELSERVENSGNNAGDPILNGILSNLGLIPCSAAPSMPNIVAANTNALNILANVNNMLVGQNQPFLNPLVNTLAQSIVQQNPNLNIGALTPDFQLNFDPRQGGLLGNAPPFPFNDNGNFNNSNNYNDDFYDEPSVLNNGNLRGRGGRGGFRDRQHQNRRGRIFNNRNNVNRNFRNRNRNNNNNGNNNRNRTSP